MAFCAHADFNPVCLPSPCGIKVESRVSLGHAHLVDVGKLRVAETPGHGVGRRDVVARGGGGRGHRRARVRVVAERVCRPWEGPRGRVRVAVQERGTRSSLLEGKGETIG